MRNTYGGKLIKYLKPIRSIKGRHLAARFVIIAMRASVIAFVCKGEIYFIGSIDFFCEYRSSSNERTIANRASIVRGTKNLNNLIYFV